MNEILPCTMVVTVMIPTSKFLETFLVQNVGEDLLKKQNTDGYTALHFACGGDNLNLQLVTYQLWEETEVMVLIAMLCRG